MKTSVDHSLTPGARLMSLDFFRGLTMFLLIGEATHIYSPLERAALLGPDPTVLHVHRRRGHAVLLRKALGTGR
jgi:hypothetical protein